MGCSKRATSSQEGLGEQEPLYVSSPAFCSIKANSKLDQVSQGYVQLESAYFLHWSLCSLSGPSSAPGKNIFPYIQLEFPFAAACAPCLSLYTSGKNLDSVCFMTPLRQLKAATGSPPSPFLLSAEQAPHPQPLPIHTCISVCAHQQQEQALHAAAFLNARQAPTHSKSKVCLIRQPTMG